MIAPESGRGNGESARRFLLRRNLLVATLIFLGLQIWRPYFFLTDDNLDGGLPFFTEMGRHLLAGRSPFVSDDLFGGHYDLLRDPTFFLWHPLYLVVSLLAGTPFRLAIIDVNAYGFFMLAVAGFVNLAWYLRREQNLELSDGWIMFYTQSFAFSMFVMTTGASWLNFVAAQSALPWLALGLFQKSWRSSFALILLFTLHQVLGGHLLATISNTIFLSLFSLGLGWVRRSWQPVLCWAAGYTVALLLLSPLLVPVMNGFLDSPRAQGVDVAEMSRNNIPFQYFPTSFFLGMALWIIRRPVDLHTTYTLALGSGAASWCLLTRLRNRTWSPLERVLAGMLALIALMICRPIWITEIMVRLPVLKSMRWPFRELLQFQFFFHLLLLVRRPSFSPKLNRRVAAFSLAIFVIPLLLYRVPPTFNTMPMDRKLILGDGFTTYWRQVGPLFQPGDVVAVLLPFRFYNDDEFDVPYSLLSTFNYSCLTRVVNAAGYSPTPPVGQWYTKTRAIYPFGAYFPQQKAALLAERPNLKFITLESLHPLRLSLSSRDGPTVDLTPFLPRGLTSP